MERKLKHLEFVQGVVNRLSTNSFLLKGWSVVIISALFALSAKDADVNFARLAFIPALVFWGLDAYFLALERNYRKLFNRVRLLLPEKIDFTMDLDIVNGWRDWAAALFSKTLVLFHLAVVVIICAVCVTYLL